MRALTLTAPHQYLQVIDLEHALQPLRLRLIETWRASASSSAAALCRWIRAKTMLQSAAG